MNADLNEKKSWQTLRNRYEREIHNPMVREEFFMTSLLLMISFLLHFIGLFAIYKLFQEIQKLKRQDSSEIMGVFESYLQEIKEENNRMQTEINATDTSEIGQTKTAHKQKRQNQEQVGSEQEEPIFNEQESSDYVETSLKARILNLHQQGFSTDAIAEKLHCGKTEAALIIKLHEKNSVNS